MPEISKDLNLTRAQFGSLASVGQVSWWSATMLAGYLGDRFSNRAGLMIAISMMLMGGGMMLAGFAPTYVTMLVAMFLVGVGPAMFHPPALGELSRRFPDRRGFAISLHGMAANVGEVLGAPHGRRAPYLHAVAGHDEGEHSTRAHCGSRRLGAGPIAESRDRGGRWHRCAPTSSPCSAS